MLNKQVDENRKLLLQILYNLSPILPTAHVAKMPGTGRPTSPWWAHFQAVEGCIQISRFLVIYLECAGDFRVARCLHCDQLVRRGKVGCTPKQTSNTGMSTHMRTKHLGQAAEVLLWIMMFRKQSCASSGSKTG